MGATRRRPEKGRQPRA